MDFSIRLRTPRPPLMNIISRHFLPHFFLLKLNPTYMKRILHLVSVKKITFKSSYDWFKIHILRVLRPPTAIFSHVETGGNFLGWSLGPILMGLGPQTYLPNLNLLNQAFQSWLWVVNELKRSRKKFKKFTCFLCRKFLSNFFIEMLVLLLTNS